MANPIDEATKKEIQDTIEAVVKTFTTQYAKHYTLGLVKRAEQESAAPEPEQWALDTRPESTEDRKCGFLTKEGAIRKSWKKRWFVIYHDYTVGYFASEADAKKGIKKSKGTIGLCGYSVIEDVGESLMKDLQKLADQMGMDISELPKPKAYPEHTIQLYHPKRRHYFIQCANDEEKKEWVSAFRDACRYAHGLTNRDEVHEKAFHESVRQTRWDLGRWGYWSYGGTEVQILSDLISDQLDYAVMGKVYSKITGSWMVRNTVRNQVLKALDTMVTAGVTPAWKGMQTAVEEIKTKIEPTIKENLDPLAKAKADILGKIKEGVMSSINPILEEHVTPHLGKILTILKSPVSEAFEQCYQLFDEEINKFKDSANFGDIASSYKNLDRFYRSWDMNRATDKLDEMHEPLWALNSIFKDIRPWTLIWNARDQMKTFMDNAMYTFEQELNAAIEADENIKTDPEAGKAAVDAAKGKVLEKYKKDGTDATIKLYASIMKDIVMPPFNELVIPACKSILEPLAELVPEALKALIDILEMFDELVNGIIDSSIETVVKG